MDAEGTFTQATDVDFCSTLSEAAIQDFVPGHVVNIRTFVTRESHHGARM